MKKIHKFLYVGVLSTLVDYFVYAFLIYIGLNYVYAIIIGYLSGFLVNFIVSRKYVFDRSKIQKLHHEFLAVLCISIVAIGINIFIVWGLGKFGINHYISRIVAIGIVFFFNYFARKVFVYE